jgi:uncharacterized protein (DUF362 family)
MKGDHSPSSPRGQEGVSPTGRALVSCPRFGRREFLRLAAVIMAGGAGLRILRDYNEGFRRADVLITKASTYEDDLPGIIRRGLAELGLGRAWAARKSVLLKPNLVEPTRVAPHVNTHPAVVRAVADVFRSWGAREVFVGEGQGHCRDSDLILEQSALGPMLDEERIEFIDLNHDDVYATRNRLRLTGLAELLLPVTLRRADLIVSLPKLKTHHWTGVTCAMKNLFGVMPGICYGWPKNVLHREGIHASILDINRVVGPHLAIVDGIVGMEGDGPIMGSPRAAGVLVMGTNLPAVDATCARLMEIDPTRVAYLAAASGRLGPIAERHIRQRGETIAALAQRFAVLDHPGLAGLRD